MDLYKTSAAAEVTVSEAPVEKAPKKAAKTVKAVKAVKVAKKEASLPEATEGAPGAEEYRLSASEIDSAVCVGRNLKGGDDKRWKPIVFRESQCGAPLAPGSDLCAKCSKRAEKYAAEPKPGDWTGRVTEEPLGWVHMLGTDWALEKKPRFSGDSSSVSAPVSSASSSAASVASEEADASDSESESVSSQTEMPASSSSASTVPVSDKKAAAAAAKLVKEAEKAKKLAEKEAEKAKKLAEKEEAAAKKLADKEAKKAAKPVKTEKKAEAKVVASNSSASAGTEVTEVTGELKLIDGTLYMVKSGNVYEYDELSEKAGDFVGRLTADETIDTEAEEVSAAESDSE
jgi:hypothetical protein